eukprot:2676485-Pyramimonas_sp.AAC.1
MAWWLQVRPGAIELSPDECAIIVNYEVSDVRLDPEQLSGWFVFRYWYRFLREQDRRLLTFVIVVRFSIYQVEEAMLSETGEPIAIDRKPNSKKCATAQ